jgi:hypothetical protein
MLIQHTFAKIIRIIQLIPETGGKNVRPASEKHFERLSQQYHINSNRQPIKSLVRLFKRQNVA